MLYSKDEILAAVRQELADANRELGIADGFTDEDYKYLGVIAAALERQQSVLIKKMAGLERICKMYGSIEVSDSI